jgi:hypothetical protein
VNYRTLGQDQLEGIFREHLQRQFGVEVELGTELVTFQREPNSVTAWLRRRTSEGSTGTEEVVATDYVVGCDGGHSGVRKGLGISFEGETLPGRQLYGDVHVEGLDIEVSPLVIDDNLLCLRSCSIGTPGVILATCCEHCLQHALYVAHHNEQHRIMVCQQGSAGCSRVPLLRRQRARTGRACARPGARQSSDT